MIEMLAGEEKRERKYENYKSHKIYINKMRSPINLIRVSVHARVCVCAGECKCVFKCGQRCVFGECVLTCQGFLERTGPAPPDEIYKFNIRKNYEICKCKWGACLHF